MSAIWYKGVPARAGYLFRHFAQTSNVTRTISGCFEMGDGDALRAEMVRQARADAAGVKPAILDVAFGKRWRDVPNNATEWR